MPGPSKVIVLDPDARASRQVQLGFEREGVPTAIAQIPLETARLELPGDDAGLVIVGGADGKALELLRRARSLLDEGHIDAPIVFAGRGVRRTDAEAAGADEVVLQPAYLRDVVTIGRLLRGIPAHQRDHLVGSLVETTGVFTLVRALAALGRSATLTLIRGLRRGEVRFYHGEVTSAQVGLIHGQAALHQLLLWTDARFDFHHEDVVRRQQIPLAPDELWADAERFLEGVRDSSGGLSPAMVLEQDVQRVQGLGKQIPTEVHGVLRMFDGHRVLADVLEDSPYRVFETLRVAQRAVDAGLLRPVEKQKPKATWRAVLAIEEWLVGSETREDVIERTTVPDSGPIAARDSQRVKKKKARRKKKRPATPLPVPTKADIDWGALVPRIVGADLGPLSGVVPASQTAGEIESPSRDVEREKLEALMDTDKRGKIFPTDIGLEPSVVFDDQATTTFERPEPAPGYAADAGSVIKDALARQQRDREEAESRARADEVRVRAEAAEWTRQEAAARAAAEAAETAAAERTQPAATERTQAEADALARRIAEARGAPRPDPAAEAQAAREAEAEAARASEAREAASSRARARADAEARARAEAEAVLEAEDRAAEQVARDTEQRAAAAREAEAAHEAQVAADVAAAAAAAAKARADAQARAAAETAERAEAEAWDLAAVEAARRASSAEPSVLVSALDSEAPSTTTAKLTAEPIAPPPQPSAATAKLTAEPIAPLPTPPPSAEEAKLVATPVAVTGEIHAAPPAEVPAAVIDAPSDGVIVQHIATLDTAPVGRRPSSVPPIDDRPDDATGEITTRRKIAPSLPPPIAEPSILVTDLAAETSEPAPPPAVEPLVADLAAAHVAIAAVATAQAAAPATADASAAKQSADVAAARKDVSVFSDAEEDFFRAGQEKTAKPPAPTESFEDLDEGYQPVGFWDRVRGKRPRR